MFLSFIGEKRWLEKMNRDGYEPTRVTPYTYEFEKTDKSVVFEYVFLKNGKKSFDALDYKQKDADAKAVYANAEVALFKKPADKGAFTILTESQKKVNLLRKRSSLYTECLIFLAVTMMLIMLWVRQSMLIMLLFAIVTGILTVKGAIQAVLLDKYIKGNGK